MVKNKELSASKYIKHTRKVEKVLSSQNMGKLRNVDTSTGILKKVKILRKVVDSAEKVLTIN